jgi:hypothetical protein
MTDAGGILNQVPNGLRVYFLHIPRSGGSNLYANLRRIGFEVRRENRNGNILDEVGNWLPFWYWNRRTQRDFFYGMNLVVNEQTLGPFMFAEFRYITCIREPIAQRRSCFLLWAKEEGIEAEELAANSNQIYRRFRLAFPNDLVIRMISNRRDHHDINEIDYSQAVLRLDRMNVFVINRLAEEFEEFFGEGFVEIEPNTLKGSPYENIKFPNELLERLHEDSVYDRRIYRAVISESVGRKWKAIGPQVRGDLLARP